MDRVTSYTHIVKSLMEEIHDQYARSTQEITHHLALDDERRQYLLITDGWLGDTRFYGIAIHIEVRDNGHVWVHDDNTDLVIVDELLTRGIPKEDMVLGWHTPSMREDTEFAVG